MKIQSISDIITNSSTEVFIVYGSNNINTIKDIVNSILSIDGNYTFDDLFTIKMTVSDSVEDVFENWEYYFPNKQKPSDIRSFWEYINSLSQNELTELEHIWDSKNTYDWEYVPFFDGYSVSIKEEIEKTDKLQKAVDAIRRLDSIFDLDYSRN
jgi:hypothetical protein